MIRLALLSLVCGLRSPDGSEPKARVQRAGYHPRLTGENIAFGPETAAEVVASGKQRGHFYWVQTLAAGS